MIKYFTLLFAILIFVLPMTAGEIIPLEDITNPGYSFHVDGNELFLVNGYSIFVYDLKPVKLKFKIGQKGEKPVLIAPCHGQKPIGPKLGVLPIAHSPVQLLRQVAEPVDQGDPKHEG